MKASRFSITPATALAVGALFFALGGSAFAVGERVQAAGASQQARCGQGAVRGIAQVTGGASGVANIPGRFSSRGALFARRYNCTGRAIQVRRLGIGIFEVRFVGNVAPTAIAAGLGGANPSAGLVAPNTFRVNVFPAGISDPADLPFVVVLV